MVDFLSIGIRYPKKGLVDIYPKFVIKNASSDLMIREAISMPCGWKKKKMVDGRTGCVGHHRC